MDTGNQFLGTARISNLMRQYCRALYHLAAGRRALYNIVDQIFIANARLPRLLRQCGQHRRISADGRRSGHRRHDRRRLLRLCQHLRWARGEAENAQPQRRQLPSCSAVARAVLALTAVYLAFSRTAITRHVRRHGQRRNLPLSRQEYFFYITLGIPFYMFGQAMNPVIRADGSPRFAMALHAGGRGHQSSSWTRSSSLSSNGA